MIAAVVALVNVYEKNNGKKPTALCMNPRTHLKFLAELAEAGSIDWIEVIARQSIEGSVRKLDIPTEWEGIQIHSRKGIGDGVVEAYAR